MFLKTFFSYIIDFLANRRCLICGAPLPHGRFGICESCEKDHSLFDSPMLQYPGNMLEERLYGLTRFESASALMKYSETSPARDIIHELKYHNEKGIGALLGEAIADHILSNDRFPRFDYVIPVPLHPNRLRSRGYNQSELIASAAAAKLNSTLSTDNLYRTRDNKTQTKKSLTERAENALNLFELRNPYEFSGATVLLIDDVFTSGATICDCCRALNSAEDIHIHIFTAAGAHTVE